MWRLKEYVCGELKDIEIFVRPEKAKVYKRAKREKESSPSQRNLNDKKSEKYFVRFIHNNFTRKDLFLDLTFEGPFLPKTRKAAIKEFKNYIARINRWRRKHGLKKLKYVYVFSEQDEFGEEARFHFHVVVENMDREVLEEKWGLGYANTDRLKFNEIGVQGKTGYMARQGGAKSTRTWGSSTGLKKVKAKTSDKEIKKNMITNMERNPEDRVYFEKLFDKKKEGWVFTSCEIKDNLITGTSFLIKMRKYEVPDYISKRREKDYMEYMDIPF